MRSIIFIGIMNHDDDMTMIVKGIMNHEDDHDFDAIPTRRGRRKASADQEDRSKATKSEERC